MQSFEPTFYAEFTSAGSAPTVIHFNPINGKTGVGTNAIIEAQFSAAIDPSTVSGVTLSAGGTTIPTSPSFGWGNTVLELVPLAPLAANTNYAMTIAGVKDPAGHLVATVTNSFTTGATYDISASVLVNYDPPNYATVGTNMVPKMMFSKPLNPLFVSNSTFTMDLNDTGQWIPLDVKLSADGLEVTLQPTMALLPNTTYRYYAGTPSALQDQNGNNVTAGWYYFYTGSGAVTSGPTVTVIPADLATDIPLNTQIRVTVNGTMDPTSWSQNSIQLLDNSMQPVPGTVAWVNSSMLTFNATSALSPGVTYTVQIPSGGFTDTNGNSVVPYTSTFTTGAAAATGGLTFTGSNITWGATVTNNVQPIVLTFSQLLDPTTVNSSTLKVMNSWNGNYGLAGTYAVSLNQVTFTPASPYPAGASIYVGECGGPTDVLGEVFQNGNCYPQQLVYFVMSTAAPDTTALQVLSVSPGSGSTNVKPDTSISVTFNKSINPSTAQGNNALLYAGQGVQDRGSISLSSDGRTLTFSTGTLYCNARYTVYLPAGGISDFSGNSLANPYDSTFDTGCNPTTGNGSVVGNAPGNNASGVPVNTLLTLYVNRQVDPSTVPGNLTVTVNGQVYPGTVQAIADGLEVQYTPTTPFPAGATVQWFFSGVYDIYGNAINGTGNVFYTAPTIDPTTAQPTIVAVSPSCCNSFVMPTNGEIDIQYSLPIDPTTVSGNIYENSGPAASFTVSVLTGLPNIVRISPPSSGWNPTTWYGFCANSSVKGTNGVGAQSSCWMTYFTTTSGPDTTPGTVTVGPPDGAINVGTNAYIRFQFSKPVDRTTVNSTNIQIKTGGNPVPGSWSYSYSGAEVYGANFSTLNPLPASSTISITTGNILDYAGNLFTPASKQFVTAALPDYGAPSASLDFGGGQSGVATNASFTCRYSEPMDPSSVYDGNTFVWSYVTNAHIPVTYTWSADLTAVTMTPQNPLYANSQYYYACYGAIDLTGNGMNNTNAWFNTGNGPSSAGPIVLQINPPNGFINVPLNTESGPWAGSSLGLLFSEPVATNTLGNITLTPQGGGPMPIGVVPEYGNTIAWVELPWALAPNTKYTYSVTGVTDYSGNPVTPTTSTFTTGSSFDYSQPAGVSTVPANNATNVDVNTPLSFTFSKAVDPVLVTSSQLYLRNHNTQVTIATTVSGFSADYKTVSLTLAAPLDATTVYDLVYWPNNWYLYDIAGNPSYNYGVWSTFTTGTPTPVNGACGSANGGAFSTPPTANLCSAGTASALANNGSWNWTCNGQYGGANAPCSANVTFPNACYPQQSGLVSWWRGNDDATDHIGNNNGTLENGAGFALGEVADAFSINGNNQYVLVSSSVPTNLQIQNAITLSAWIYPTAYPSANSGGYYGLIVGSQEDSHTAGASIFFNGNNSISGVPIGSIVLSLADGSNWYSAGATTQVLLNQWTLVTATRTAHNTAQIYYDGVAQPTTTWNSADWPGTISYSGAWFAIGQQQDYNRPFTGLIDEVQVYNTALSAAQIQGIYNAGSTGMCP